ncbi:hypothetical protein VV867_08835 [Pseudomonas sp. JH-2]|uniref:hypothetical protein n=1 Tax=Pseudomonas sp. JH-2 TaxID=3114998 RepID=UPI002E254C95|nr:hypothetical protein [Pseudomonas sp. JH-2]
MSDIGRPADRLVRIAVPADHSVAVAEDERDLVLAEEPLESVGLSIEPQEPRAVAIQQSQPQGLAYQGVPLFNVVAGLQGRRGEQGIPGPAGGSSVQKIASVPLSGHRLVFSPDGVTAEYADCGVLPNRINTLGLTLGAADLGSVVNIQRAGEVTFEGWAWADGAVFLGHAGQLTQTLPPDAVFSLIVGFAMNATTLFLDMGVAITLAQEAP